MRFGYALGCPVWSNKAWNGNLFTRKAKPNEFLRQYASVFNTVEGNTTFYALPKPETVFKWRDDTPEDFRFCLKFPRTISHDKRLRYAEAETEYFFRLFAPIRERLGPLFLQLPPSFGPRELPSLYAYLSRLPEGFQYAVEVRHWDFFRGGRAEQELDAMLADKGVNRVLFDGRGVHSAESQEQAVLEAQRKKPKVPPRYIATSEQPMVRYIAHPVWEYNVEILRHWAHVVAGWIREGLEPYVFIHTPDDTFAPPFARRFHSLLQELQGVSNLPEWPGELEPEPAEQLSLF